MLSYLERYLQGEHARVWDELAALEEAIVQEPYWPEALAVIQETMRRVRWNVEEITRRLEAAGYRFGVYPDGKTKIPGSSGPYHPPQDRIGEAIAAFERLDGVGSLPLSIQWFWRIVGDVDWMGCHPRWPAYSDPLVVYPLAAAQSEYEDWRFTIDEMKLENGPFGIPIAPDYFHKDNVSGGSPYTLYLPNATVDGILEYEQHRTTFVNYLRICFSCGGFPGVEGRENGIPEEMTGLAQGLIPI